MRDALLTEPEFGCGQFAEEPLLYLGLIRWDTYPQRPGPAGHRLSVARAPARCGLMLAMAASYGQIVTTLRDEIVSGAYAAAVPPGAELAARFEVSESTINRALSQLRSEGLVRTQQGRGTVVNPVPVIRRDAVTRQRAGERESGGSRGAFDAELRAAGLDPRTEVEVGCAVPPDSIARLLDIPEGTEAVCCKRRMYAGTWPVQVATSWIPASIADGTPITEQDTGPGGIYSRLAELGHAPARFTEEVTVRVPDDDEVAALGIDPDHRVYAITRVASDRTGRAVEVNTIVMPPTSGLLPTPGRPNSRPARVRSAWPA